MPQVRVKVPKSEPAPAPKSFGRFELIERIGVGGMAEVFRAQVHGPEGFKRELVVKRVLPHLSARSRFTQMFVNEAKISALLNHPNIVQIFEFGESDGSYFIAMESVRGMTLREALTKLRARDAVMPVVTAMEIAREILVALDYAHNLRDADGRPLNIVHRDISPSNAMLALNGAVKVLDFGIARAADLIEEDDTKVVKGKIAYLAPEQISLVDVDARADLFALGCVLFEMLAGRLLFRAQNDLHKKLALLAQPSPRASTFNPEVPPAVDAIVLKAVERAPGARYDSAGDMLVDVENYLSSFRSANRSVLRLVRSLGDSAGVSDSFAHSSASSSEAANSSAARVAAAASSSTSSPARNSTPNPLVAPGPRPQVLRAPTSSFPVARLEGAANAEWARVGRLRFHRWWGLLGLAIVVAAVLMAASRGRRELVTYLEHRRAAALNAPPAPVPLPIVLVTFVSKPSGARIVDAVSGRVLGETPATLPVTQALRPVRFRLEKDGYAPVMLEPTPDVDKILNSVLRPAAPAGKSSARRKPPQKSGVPVPVPAPLPVPVPVLVL